MLEDKKYMFLKKILILMIIGTMYSFKLRSDDFKITGAATVMVISGAYLIKRFITTNKEKKLFKKFYPYKGKMKELIENCETEQFKKEHSESISESIAVLKKKHTYNIDYESLWKDNICGQNFLEDFITTIFKVDCSNKKEYIKFFLNDYTHFNDYIEKNIRESSWSSQRNKHIWFKNNFKSNQLIEIVHKDGHKTDMQIPVGTHYTHEKIQKSMPGSIISTDKINDRIINEFNLIKKIMLEGKNTAKWDFPMNILAGAPGTGKTIRVKEIFLELCNKIEDKKKCFYIQLKTSDILSKWIGDSEKNTNDFFQEIKKLGHNIKDDGFVLVHLDEIESLLGKRDASEKKEWSKNIVNEFLQGIDNLRYTGVPVLILGTTNFCEQIDEAAKREGRLKIITIEKPNDYEKNEIINFYVNYFNGETYNIELTEEQKKEILKEKSTGAGIRDYIQTIFFQKLNENYEGCRIQGPQDKREENTRTSR